MIGEVNIKSKKKKHAPPRVAELKYGEIDKGKKRGAVNLDIYEGGRVYKDALRS